MSSKILEDYTECVKVYEQIRCIYENEKYNNSSLYYKALSKTTKPGALRIGGVEKTSLLYGLLVLFYEKGKEDALKELSTNT